MKLCWERMQNSLSRGAVSSGIALIMAATMMGGTPSNVVKADEALPRIFVLDEPAQRAAPAFPPVTLILQDEPGPKTPVPPTPGATAADDVKDAPYEVKTLAEMNIKADIRERLLDKAGKKLPMPTFHGILPNPHYSAVSEVFTRPDGSWIDQRLTGPVAPFEFLPTYFQDDSLERFGQTHGFAAQSLLSMVHFYGTVPVLPYKMALKPPCQPAFPSYFPPPISLRGKIRHYGRQVRWDAVGVEAAAIAAIFLLFP